MRRFLVTHKKTGEKVELSGVAELSKHVNVPAEDISPLRLFKVSIGEFQVFEYLNTPSQQTK